MGGRFHPRLNMNTRPIVNKYREGKVKRTLKRGLKVPEIVRGEANAKADIMLIMEYHFAYSMILTLF